MKSNQKFNVDDVVVVKYTGLGFEDMEFIGIVKQYLGDEFSFPYRVLMSEEFVEMYNSTWSTEYRNDYEFLIAEDEMTLRLTQD